MYLIHLSISRAVRDKAHVVLNSIYNTLVWKYLCKYFPNFGRHLELMTSWRGEGSCHSYSKTWIIKNSLLNSSTFLLKSVHQKKKFSRKEKQSTLKNSVHIARNSKALRDNFYNVTGWIRTIFQQKRCLDDKNIFSSVRKRLALEILEIPLTSYCRFRNVLNFWRCLKNVVEYWSISEKIGGF